jgi:membrane protease YdiL (CAAX protease family)
VTIPSDAAQQQDLRSFARGRPRTLALILSLVFTAVWFVLLSHFGQGDVYAVMGPYACAVSAACFALRPRELSGALAIHRRAVLSGLAVGVLMTALTYPVFQLAVKIAPWLDGQVQALYHGARSTTLPKALAWVTAVMLAEELLFRGLWPLALRGVMGPRKIYALALLAYSLAQLGSGSWIVALLAFVCGSAWTLLRVYTGSLLAPVIAHAIWTPVVILLYPVT